MKLSKFYHSIELENDIVAIYNSLVMDVRYVNKNELDNIVNFKVDSKLKKELMSIGIYIENQEKDISALKVVTDRYNKVSGKLHIMYLIMTSTCNLACKYCFVENSKYNNKKEFTMNETTIRTAVIKYTEYLKENNIKDATILFYGGEPLVNYEGIKIAIELAKELKAPVKFSIVTNGTLLNEEVVKYFKINKVEIGISIDGPKELNDKNRIYKNNQKSVYDEIINKINLLKKHKCKFGLSITISEDFLEHKEEVMEWIENLGVNSIFYNLYHYTEYDKNWELYSEKATSYLLESHEKLSQKAIFDGRLNRKIDSFIDAEFKFADCGAIGANQIAIKPNGEICICHGYLKTDKYVIGNINVDSLKEIMHSEEMLFWKSRSTLFNDKCLECEAIYSCGGGCAIQSEALFNSRSEIDVPFCIHCKKSLKWILQKCYDNMK